MSAADVTPEVVAKLRDDINIIASRGLRGMLPHEDTLSLLDALESAWHERDDLRAKLDVMEENATTAAFDKISDHFAESERENVALRAEVERLRQGQAVEVQKFDLSPLELAEAWDERDFSILSRPAPSADVVTVPREALDKLQEIAIECSEWFVNPYAGAPLECHFCGGKKDRHNDGCLSLKAIDALRSAPPANEGRE